MTRHDDAALTRYLLGHLADEERAALEEKYFVDDDLMAQLQAVETDLIDAYVRGKLPNDDRAAFEVRYLASPEGRARVETATRLLSHTAARRSHSWSWVVPVTAVAASAVLATGAFLLSRPAVQDGTSPAVQTPVASGNPVDSPRPVPPPLVFVLHPTTRSQTTSAPLVITREVEQVELRARIEGPATDSKYRATLTTPEGREVYMIEEVSVAPGDPELFRIVVPAPQLSPGDYILTIAFGKDGSPSVVGEFAFRVVQR